MASSSFFHPNFILQIPNPREEDNLHNHHHQSAILNPLFPSSNPHEYSTGKRQVSISGNLEACEAEEEVSDDYSQIGEKKRRLSMEKVLALERSFELGNKLEPERKMQLAMALGLKPRQISIWFQNRRARWKTKQLEKDYDFLKVQFEAIKAENDALQSDNKILQSEIMALRGRETMELINLNRETEGSCSNRTENSFGSPLNTSKIGHGVDEDHFGSLICGMDGQDQPAFWPWPDHHGRH